jgi:serine/threonine protein phosphatase PrpC
MFCIFASDGVWEFLSSQKAVDIVWENRADMKVAANRLVEESTIAWKQEEEVIDDITCTIVQFCPELQTLTRG